VKELWKPIEDTMFEVSNYGRIRNKNTLHIKEQRLSKCGYLRINLVYQGKKKTLPVHRLVALAFIQNPSGYDCVNHKDECKTNNHVDNLEWCTVGYNNTYGTSRMRAARTKSKPVVQKDLSGNAIRYFPSIKLAEDITGLRSGVMSCCIGKQKTSGGYRWEYAV